MLIRPSDIHEDWDKARIGFLRAAVSLGLNFNASLMSMWKLEIKDNELATFLELAKESCFPGEL